MMKKTIIRSNIDALRWKAAEEQNPIKRREIYRLLAEERAKLAPLDADSPTGNMSKRQHKEAC